MSKAGTKLTMESTALLNDGRRIPILGFGVFQAKDGAECESAVRCALDCGYRHIDTAVVYENEASVGSALEKSGVSRGDVFITTKTGWDQSPGGIRKTFAESLDKLRTDYVDLFLVHWPLNDAHIPAMWETLEAFKAEGRCRSIGISNFTVERLQSVFLPAAKTPPAVNQIELHVFNQQAGLVDFCRARGMVLEAYSPMARAKRLSDPRVGAIAARHGKEPAQVMIRFLLQQGIVCLPKSVHPARIASNADVFDFELAPGEMELLKEMNENCFVREWIPEGYY